MIRPTNDWRGKTVAHLFERFGQGGATPRQVVHPVQHRHVHCGGRRLIKQDDIGIFFNFYRGKKYNIWTKRLRLIECIDIAENECVLTRVVPLRGYGAVVEPVMHEAQHAGGTRDARVTPSEAVLGKVRPHQFLPRWHSDPDYKLVDYLHTDVHCSIVDTFLIIGYQSFGNLLN